MLSCLALYRSTTLGSNFEFNTDFLSKAAGSFVPQIILNPPCQPLLLFRDCSEKP